MVPFNTDKAPERDPENASLSVTRREKLVDCVGLVVDPESEIVAVGRSVSMTYARLDDPVKVRFLANTWRSPVVEILPPEHVNGTLRGRIPQSNHEFPAPEKVTDWIRSPVAPVTCILVFVIGALLRIVGAMIFTTGG